MAVRYAIPSVSAQKGPTCWYYTMKMLLRFHHLIGPGEDLYQHWKRLHHVRRACTALDEAKQKRTPDNIRGKLREFEAAEGFDQALHDACKMAAGLQGSARFVIAEEYLPGRLQEVQLQGNLDAAFVERSLRSYGPLYASIHSFGKGPFDQDLVPDPLNAQRWVYTLDPNGQEGGRHAILISGIDGEQRVYFNDPNHPHRFTMVPWEVLKSKLNSPGGSTGASLFGAAVCPRCSHLNQQA